MSEGGVSSTSAAGRAKDINNTYPYSRSKMSASQWSVPQTEVIGNIGDLIDADQDAVLTTIINVKGNAYRRPGAKMVIDEKGGGSGSITAGCLEDEIQQLAEDVIEEQRLRVKTYDLMEDDDDVWGLGVGCNGIIDVLLEPLNEGYRPAVEASKQGEDIAVITVLATERSDITCGDRTYYRPGEGFEALDEVPPTVADTLTDAAKELARSGKADTFTIKTNAGRVTLFIDGIAAPPELVILGSGHDVGPVVELAKRNDFQVSVVGFRGAATLDQRFPQADITKTASPASLREVHEFDSNTYAVVMTHNFVDDRFAVEELLETTVPYVGLMGPRERFEEMLDKFADEGQSFSDEKLDRIYTPIGIDLGGGSPYQIATSIVAEILAIHNDRTPRHLKAREEPIHDRVEVTESMAKD